MIRRIFFKVLKNQMIIPELRRLLRSFWLLCLLLYGMPAICQNLQPAPAFDLIHPGYGAAAMGMGGAYTAVARDLSAIFWNPAGLAQLNGVQIGIDYRILGDSSEDFGAEAFPNRFESKQRFSISGKQFQSLLASFSIRTKNYVFVPAFAWQRPGNLGIERELKETAGVVEFLTPSHFFQSEGTFREVIHGAEDEYTFGIAAGVTNKVLIGGTWTFLHGGPERILNGNFHETVVTDAGTQRADLTVQQTRKEDSSGNYLKVGALFFPYGPLSFGGYLRFPYNRTTHLSFDVTGTSVPPAPIGLSATADAEVKYPMEWAAGVALHQANHATVAGSVTYSDMTDTVQTITNSSNTVIFPERDLPFPGLRVNAVPQHKLLQLRAGIEYVLGSPGSGVVLRSGIFRDGQPYGNTSNGRVKFHGYSFGAGFQTSTFRLDAAMVKETGDITFTQFSQGPSTYRNRRFLISVSFLSQ
jgi:hypothetical protein